MLTALTDITGDFSHAISEMGKVLKVHGRVIPAANKKSPYMLCLRTVQLLRANQKSRQRQNALIAFLVPENVQPLPEAIRAILRADYILIGPEACIQALFRICLLRR